MTECDLEKQMWRLETYKSYGLNKYRNFVRQSEPFITNSEEELEQIIADLLFECECETCAVFVHRLNGSMEAAVLETSEYELAVLDEEEIPIMYYSSTIKNDSEFFAKTDAKCRTCCYTLIVEAEPNSWRFVEN